MAYAPGCKCDDCLLQHRVRWVSLSDRQSLLLATLHNKPLSASSLRSRGFKANTIGSLMAGKPLLRCLSVSNGERFYAPSRRGQEVYAQALAGEF
jgi:hypothetical protein